MEDEVENIMTQQDMCRDALNDLSQGNAWEFKDAIDNILNSKIMDGIETTRFQLGSSMFTPEEE